MLIWQVANEEPPSPRKLNGSVPRDLETICLKCMQKAPGARYQRADDVAQELQRFLDGKPIQARPVGSLGKVWRWCRRNPVVATSSGIAVACLIVAFAAVSTGYVVTSDALRRSEENYLGARQAVDELFVAVSENDLLDQPGMQPLRETLLKRSLEHYRRFLDQEVDDPTLQAELARTHFRVGAILYEIGSHQEALDSLIIACDMQEQLLKSRPDDITIIRALSESWTRQGNVLHAMGKNQARGFAWQRAYELRYQLVKLAPDDPENQFLLGSSVMNLGIQANSSQDSDATTKATNLYTAAQDTYKKVWDQGTQDPKLKRGLAQGLGLTHYNLAILASEQDDQEGAEQHYRSAIRYFSENPELRQNFAIAYYWGLAQWRLGITAQEAGRWQEAANEFRVGEDIVKPLAERNPDVHRFQLLLVRLMIGHASSTPNDAEFNDELLQSAIELGRKLSARINYSEYQSIVGQAELLRGRYLLAAGQDEQGIAALKRAWDVFAQVLRKHPNYKREKSFGMETLGYLMQEYSTERDLAGYQKLLNQFTSLISSNRAKGLAILERISEQLSETHVRTKNRDLLSRMALLQHYTTVLLESSGKPIDRSARRTVELWEQYAGDQVDQQALAIERGIAYMQLGFAETAAGNEDAAAAAHRQGIELLESCELASKPLSRDRLALLDWSYIRLNARRSQELDMSSRPAETRELSARSLATIAGLLADKKTEMFPVAIRLRTKLYDNTPETYRSQLARTHSRYARALASGDNTQLQESLKQANKAVELQPDASEHWQVLALAQYHNAQWSDSLASLERVEETEHAVETHLLRAACYARQSKDAEAQQSLDLAEQEAEKREESKALESSRLRDEVIRLLSD